MTDYFKSNKTANRCLKIIYTVLPLYVFANYPILLFYTFFWRKNTFLETLVVPAAVFALITVLRKIIKRQPPYDCFEVAPVIPKKSEPDSMPSRHTASAFIIAMTVLSINTYAGIFYIIIALLISLSRIFAGVHYISDVIVGAVISILCGVIFLFVI